MKLHSFILKTTGLFLFACHASGAVLYVNLSNSTPTPPYASWTSAAKDIQSAIDVAAAGDFIVVSNGTYNTGGRAVYGHVTNRVAIDKAVTVFSLSGAKYTAIAGAYSGVRCVYMTNGATLIGFTLTNGGARFSGDSLTNQNGGGVWCESPSATLSNCVITASSAANQGGGAYSGTLVECTITNNNASAGGGAALGTLLNCKITSNFAGTAGGGTFSSLLSNCTLSNNGSINVIANLYGGGSAGGYLTNCTLLQNAAQYGGGVCSNILVNCYLSGNWATNFGRPGAGGAAYASALTNCVLVGNSATNGNGGGAIYGTLAGCSLTNNRAANGGGACSNTLNNCWLVFNKANNGGGVYRGILNNCTLFSNSVSGNGGGSYFANLTNCLLLQNQASGNGGGAAFGISHACLIANNSSGTFSGGIYSNMAVICTLNSNTIGSYGSRLSRCTYNYFGTSYYDILDNCEFNYSNGYNLSNPNPGIPIAINSVLNNCTALYHYRSPQNPNSSQPPLTDSCFITNSIIFGNLPYVDYHSYFNHCCVSFNTNGSGNFTNNPLFMDDSFHLTDGSPCINAGDTSSVTSLVDFDGRTRFVGNTVDIGATEFQGADIEPFISWLAQNNLPDDGSADDADSDGDNVNNWQEWLADTSRPTPCPRSGWLHRSSSMTPMASC